MQRGKVDEAMAAFRTALDLDPKFVRSHTGLGNALAKKGRLDEAIAAYRQSLDRDPKYAKAHVNLSLTLERTGQLEEAVAAARRAVALDPDLPNAYLALGLALRSRGELDDALAVFSEAIRRQLPGAGLWRERANCFARQGKWRQAAADYAQASQRSPNDPALWYDQAVARLAAQDRDGYRRVCAGMLERFANAKTPSASLWVVHTCILGPEAVPDYRQVLRLGEQFKAKYRTNWYWLTRVGGAYYRAGRFEEAIQTSEAACQVHGSAGNAYDWLFLALAHHRLGRAAEARRWLDKAGPWIERASRGKIADSRTPTPLAWNDRVALEALRREVEALLGAGPAPQTKQGSEQKP
jgi:superkiller protein 3